MATWVTAVGRWPALAGALALAACGANSAGGPRDQLHARAKDDHDGRYLAYRLRQEGCAPDHARGCCEGFEQRLQEATARGQGLQAARALQVLATACPDMRERALQAVDRKTATAAAPGKPPPLRLRWAADIDPGDRILWAAAFVDGRYQPEADLPPGAHVLEIEMDVLGTGSSKESAIHRVQGRKELALEADGSRTYVVTLHKPPGGDGFVLSISEGPIVPPSSPRLAEQMKGRHTPPPGLVIGKRESYQEPLLPREFSGHNRWRGLLMVCVDSAGNPHSVLPMNPAPHPRLLGAILDSFLHAHFTPTTFEGEPIPHCHPVNLDIS